MKQSNVLEEMAEIVSEIQATNTWIDDARTNRIARIRYQKSKPRFKDLVETHKKLTKVDESRRKEDHPCTNH